MTNVTIEGDDSPELENSMSDAVGILSTASDVKGIVLLVFLDEQPHGAVSLRATGQLPDPDVVAAILRQLLTPGDVTGE